MNEKSGLAVSTCERIILLLKAFSSNSEVPRLSEEWIRYCWIFIKLNLVKGGEEEKIAITGEIKGENTKYQTFIKFVYRRHLKSGA